MDPKYIAPYVLRSYTWELLKRNTDLTDDDYDADGNGDGLIPIVPLGEEPELAQFDKPYIVYGYAESPTGELYAKNNGNMVYVIYSSKFEELGKITNIIKTAFERGDESARDVNEFSSTIGAFVGIRFGTIEVGFLEGGSPEEDEGGRMSAAINIRYEYYAEYEVQTSFATFENGEYVRTTP